MEEVAMRVLFSTLPASGHWHPLVPFAKALRAAGHEVAFATAPSGCAAIAALRFACFPAGTDETAEEAQARRDRSAALGPDDAAWIRTNFFAGTWAMRRLPDLLTICQDWQPAVVVREES